jgi:hypothetical protein
VRVPVCASVFQNTHSYWRFGTPVGTKWECLTGWQHSTSVCAILISHSLSGRSHPMHEALPSSGMYACGRNYKQWFAKQSFGYRESVRNS